jgi:hypothetical protein
MNLNDVFDFLIQKSMKSDFWSKLLIEFVFRQGSWTREDFRCFLNALFSNKKRPYCILSDLVEQYFRETDFNRVNFNLFS